MNDNHEPRCVPGARLEMTGTPRSMRRLACSILATSCLGCASTIDEPHPRARESPATKILVESTAGRSVSSASLPKEVYEVISPSGETLLRSPWVPIVVRLPTRFMGASVDYSLNGTTATDPFGLLTTRKPRHGGGATYIATLPLTDLEPGRHRLEFLIELAGEPDVRLVREFDYERPPHRVRCRVTDGSGPTSARILVLDDRGRPYNLASGDARLADPSGRDAVITSFFAIDGEGLIDLDPGTYEFVAIRGVLDHVDAQRVTLTNDDEVVDLRISRAIETPGWVTADFHVHTGRSSDSFLPDRLRFESILAAGLDAYVITDHDSVSDLTDVIAALMLGESYGVAGVEARIGRPSSGHFNAFPIASGPPLPILKRGDFALHIDAYREHQRAHHSAREESDILIQLNHPRGIAFRPGRTPLYSYHAFFNALGFDVAVPVGRGRNAWMTTVRSDTGTTPLGFDALEVVNRFSFPLYLRVRRDWFAMMNHGFFHTGTGNSDSHALAIESVGFPINLVKLDNAALDAESLVRAVRDGRVRVSNGPIVDLFVTTESGRGGPGDLVTGSNASVHVTVRATPWVRVPEARLIVNGKVARRARIPESKRATDGTLDASFEWALHLDGDTWILAEAGWSLDDPDALLPRVSGLYAYIAPGHVPLGFTNAVRLDHDGNGRWDSALGPPRDLEP